MVGKIASRSYSSAARTKSNELVLLLLLCISVRLIVEKQEQRQVHAPLLTTVGILTNRNSPSEKRRPLPNLPDRLLPHTRAERHRRSLLRTASAPRCSSPNSFERCTLVPIRTSRDRILPTNTSDDMDRTKSRNRRRRRIPTIGK